MVFLLALATFANGIPNGFAYDDIGVIAKSPTINHLRWTRVWNQGYWPQKIGWKPDALYRPITILSYLMNRAVSTSAWPFHLVNVALYGLVCALVYVLAWRMTRRKWVAFAAGLIFAVHPLHTEVVSNIVGRAELLAAFWSLCALLIFLPTGPILEAAPKIRAWWHGCLVALCMTLAIMSKETPAGLLLAFPIIDLWRYANWPEPRPSRWRWMRGQALRYYLPMWTGFGIYMALRLHAVGFMTPAKLTSPVVNALFAATPAQRIITPFMLLGKYVYLYFWPVRLSADYSVPSLMPTANLLNPLVLLGLGTFICAILAVVTYWRKNPPIAILTVLLALAYGLVANVLRIGTIFGERLFFWPSVFLTILLCQAAATAWTRYAGSTAKRRPRWILAGAVSVLVALMALRSVRRNPVWKSNLTVALAAAQDNPDSARNCSWAGRILIAHSSPPQFRSVALELLRRSIRLWPSLPDGYWALGLWECQHGQGARGLFRVAQAAKRSVALTSTRWKINRALALLAQFKNPGLLRRARDIVRSRPKSASAQYALALAFCVKHEFTQAVHPLDVAVGLDDGFGQAFSQLGMVEARDGRYMNAVAILRGYVSHAEGDAEARCALAGALMHLNARKYPFALPEARVNLMFAHMIRPRDPEIDQLMDKLAKLQRQSVHMPKKSVAQRLSPASRVGRRVPL